MTQAGDNAHPLPRIYCAGPLFNRAERDEMTALAAVLHDAGFPVFLPHRDGMEFRKIHHRLVKRNWPAPQAARFLHEAIFALDVYQLAVECGGMLWNLNGRVPDEGAVSEAAIAWTLGKPVVGYSDDVRSLIAGRPNPLLVGLVDFQTVAAFDDIPEAMQRAISVSDPSPLSPDSFPPKLHRAVQRGRRLWSAMTSQEQTAGFAAGVDNKTADTTDAAIAEAVIHLFAPAQNVEDAEPAP